MLDVLERRDPGDPDSPAWAALGAAYATGGAAGNTISLRWQPTRPLLTAIFAPTLLSLLLALVAAARAGRAMAVALLRRGACPFRPSRRVAGVLQSCSG